MQEAHLGWTPLSWSAREVARVDDKSRANCRAVATGDSELVRPLLRRRVALNAPWMRESPLQLAAAVGDTRVLRLLIDAGADLNASSTRYDRPPAPSSETNEPTAAVGTPCALALAAAFGHAAAFDLLLAEYRGWPARVDVAPSIADLLAHDAIATVGSGSQHDACAQSATFSILPGAAQSALSEALYFALTVGNLAAAYDLTFFGL